MCISGDSPVENVYSEPDESDVKGDSRASIGPADHQQVSSSSDQSAKQFHTNNSNSNANNNNNHHHQKTTEKHAVRVKALLPPDVKPTANAKTKSDATNTAILHDENGYAMPFIKSSNAAAPSGKTQNSPPKSKGKLAGKADDKSSAARNVGVKTIVLPAKSREKSQPETGAYCNVVLKDRESKSFSNEIYEDSDMQVPKVPKNTRATLKVIYDLPGCVHSDTRH